MYKNFTLNFEVRHAYVYRFLLVMRLTVLILLVAFMQLSASTMAQKVTMVEKNASLEHVLREIRKQTGYSIIYDLDAVLHAKPVSINVKGVSVFEAIQQSLVAQSLGFSFEGRTIVIKERTLTERIAEAVIAEEVRIIVQDSVGRLLPGANVYDKTRNKMYTTNSKGEVLITNIPKNGLVLQITYVGNKTEEIFVDRKSGSPALVIMRPVQADLKEINVVSTGYQKISRDRVAGAYTVVSSEELAKTPAVNLMDRLEGKVPGVKFDVKNNTVQIRGVNNYGGNGGLPLIVIDGFVMINSSDQPTLTQRTGSTFGNPIISNLNIADIEQITFLKDASATSIWGSRAANGVIVIDTKKGKASNPSLNFSYVFGISKNPSLSKLKWMNSAQYVNLEQEMVDKGFITDPALATPGNEIYAQNNSEATEWMFKVKRGTATVQQRDAALAEISSRNGQQQIEDNLMQNAINNQYNLSYSGGTEHSNYYVSGGYVKDVPVFKKNVGENAFLNANTSTSFLNKRITLRTLLNYQYSKSIYNSSGVDALSSNLTSLRPYDLLLDASGNPIFRTNIFRQSIADSYTAQGYLPFGYNAVDQLNYSNYTSKNNVFRFNAGLNGKITSWLNADVSISSQRQIGYNTMLDELNSYNSRILVNTGTVVTNGKLVYNVPYGGKIYTANENSYDTGLRGQLNSDFTLHNIHHVNIIAGAEIRETGSTRTNETRYGYNEDTGGIGAANPTDQYMTFYGYSSNLGQNLSGILQTRKRYLSYYSNASYAFNDKYFATGSVRFDDYTQLGLDRSKRAKPFWSAGVRWNATREDFLSDIKWINNLSVRATVGTAGSIPLSGTNLTLIDITGTDQRTGQPLANISTPANSALSWETTRSYNLGLDFNLFHNKLSGTFDIYKKRTSGILSNYPYNATYGWSSLVFNSGTLNGNGYEFGLNSEVLHAGMFSWKSTLNFSYNTNKVTDVRYENNASSLAGSGSTVAGMPLGSLYVYRWAGLDNKGQSQIYDRNNNIISSTTNLTSAFTKQDLKYAGRQVAPYTAGFMNTFRYGQFEANVQITGYFGHVFTKTSLDSYPTFQGNFSGVLGRNADLALRWRNPGDEATTNVPGLSDVNFSSINRYSNSDLLVRKADNIRLQQVSLGYVVPQRMLPAGMIKSLTISANVRNLGLIWRANKDGIDPEYVNTVKFSGLPPTQSYVFGLNASF
ncbi:hypothetical protein AY601_2812 [Pedobacter cryoconitis]|uniref:TonB-dependent receptor plug domain-containing protein n=1 Tax=Pedobacter cryoconitis TaxID=188932 RepID=A0A127VEE9_9SPHI|nr:SusC/RagA family TonB-linked outer membrane protein [Pedobacter cryoconitis]AMP99694.1 hypothetical protein AY601_2812 [Pedobacter cryoconitis]